MKKFILIIFILVSLLSSCTNDSTITDDSVQIKQEFRNTAPEATAAAVVTVAPTGKTETEQRKQGDVQSIESEGLAPEIAYNPKFQDCVGVRTGSGGDGSSNIRAFTICRAQNLRVLVQNYIDALNNSDINLVNKYIEEKYLIEHTQIFEEKSGEVSNDDLKLTWIEEDQPGMRGSKRASMFINVTAENFSERWLVEFLEIGKRGDGIWSISLIDYNR